MKLPPPPPPPDVAVCSDVAKLAPAFRAALNRALAHHRALGFDPMIAETLRTNARQLYLYGFGRDYDDGRGTVTNSRDALHTWHGFGLAVDVISKSKGWDATHDFWMTLRDCVEQEGLVSGASWLTFPDKPHVQWGAPMRRSPSDHAAELLAAGGLPAVWKEVHANG